MIPPPIPTILPPEPPDPDALPSPPELVWAPLGAKDGGRGGDIIEVAIVPLAADEVPIPPPPPIVETPFQGGPDPNAMALVRPEMEIWRGDSQWPQIPARFSNRLNPAYVTGTEPVWLRAQFNSAAAGKKVLVRTGLGITVNATGAAVTISSSGECLVLAQLAEGFNRSHINFYCDGVKTVLPVLRATLATVEAVEEETGGGH